MNQPALTEFESLLSVVLDAAYGMARNLASTTADAEDLLQEATLRAYAGFPTYARGTNFKAWFFRILINLSLNEKRREHSRPQSVEFGPGCVDDILENVTHSAGNWVKTDPHGLLIDRLNNDQINAAFMGLRPEFRAVALLYFFDERTYDEISEILGCPVGTVRSRLHRARRLLQMALADLASGK